MYHDYLGQFIIYIFIKYDVYTVLTPTIYVLLINIGRN